MTADLRTQIRALYGEICELQGPIELDEIHRRDDSVPVVGLSTAPPRRSPPRLGIAVAAAATMLLIILAPLLLLRGSPQPSPAITVPEPVGLDPVDPGTAVEAALEAHNTGVWDAFAARYVVADVRSGANRSLLESLMAAGNQITIDRPCTESIPSVSGSRVTCGLVMRDGFHGAGGLELEIDAIFVVDESGLLVSSDFGLLQAGWEAYGEFDRAFGNWLQNAYPEEYAALEATALSGHPDLPSREEIGARIGDLPSREGMPIALRRVEEFVAQSVDYPLP